MAGNLYDQELQDLVDSGTPTPAPSDPRTSALEDVIRESQQGAETRLRVSQQAADPVQPDRAADTIRYSQKTGLPLEVVERNFDTIKKRALVADTPYAQMQRETPALVDWLGQEPAQAAVAKDDLANLGFLEWLTKAPLRAIRQGEAQTEYSGLRYASLVRDLTVDEHARLDTLQQELQSSGGLGTEGHWFRGAITGAASQLPIMYGALLAGAKYGLGAAATAGLATAATGAEPLVPAVAAGGFAAGMAGGTWTFLAQQMAGQAYDEFSRFKDELGRPLDPGVAKVAALATGLLAGGLQTVGLEAGLKAIPGIDGLVGAGAQNAVRSALRSPTVRAALAEAAKTYAGTLTTATATQVAARGVQILAGELVKATGGRNVPGQLEAGNVDLFKQPKVPNADGSVSTVDSVSVNIDGKEVLLSRVTPDGRHLTTEQAVEEYNKTGQQLGVFESPEAATAFAQQLHADYAAGRYDAGSFFLTPGDIAADLAHEAASAVQSFALMLLPGPLGRAALGSMHAREAQQNATFFRALGEGVKQSKTVERSPESAQAFLAQAAKDGPVETVYAPIDTWTQYWQSKGLDPAAIAAEVTGKRDAFVEAQRTGTDLAIPIAAYAVKIAPTEHNAYFQNELRLAPEQMNAREGKAFEEFLKAQPPPETAGPTGPAAVVREHMLAQLEGAGFERSTASKIANLYESAFPQLSERAGVNPIEVFNRYGTAVTREGINAIEKGTQPGSGLGEHPGTGALPNEGGTGPNAQTERGNRNATGGAVAEGATVNLDTAAGAAQTGVGDTGATSGSAAPGEGGGAPAVTRVTASTPPARESLKRQTARRTEHYDAVFDAVLANARRVDPTVDPVALRTEFDARVAAVESLNADFVESGHNPRTLLEAIAKYGGLNLKAETGMVGELRWVRESPALGKFGAFAGVAGVFKEKTRGKAGGATGLSLDDMLTNLRQDPAFAHINTVNELLTELEDISRLHDAGGKGVTFPGTRELAKQAGMLPDRAWWGGQQFDQGPVVEKPKITLAVGGSLAIRFKPGGPEQTFWIAPQGEKGSAVRGGTVWLVSREGANPLAGDMLPIDVKELGRLYAKDQLKVLTTGKEGDVLPTGEVQPRLPEAGAVRDQNIATPQLEAPFALTSEVAKASKVKQTTLFQAMFQGTGDNRGSITFGPNQEVAINLLKSADLSTFLHETGHFFLEVMGDLTDHVSGLDPAALSDSQKKLLNDYGTILQWLGVENRGQLTREQHEQFARGFEAYLMEGKAPSVELRSAFASFRAWLVGVYRSIAGLNVQLTDEVRGVMDRLVASDEAIEQAQAEGEVRPLFTDAASAGMTPEGFAAYRDTVQQASDRAKDELQRQVLKEFQREQASWWKSERDTMRASVADEVHQQPVYRALAAMRDGTNPDGTPLVEGQEPAPMKLSKRDLVARYGEGILKQLPRPYVYTVEGGLHPDAVAELFGFSSGDELVQSLIGAKSMKTVIEAETDARMKAKHGDLLIDGRLADKAEAAVNGEHRQKVVYAELKALTTDMVKGTIPPARVINASAEQTVARQTVREIRPGSYLMAARRASQKAFDLLATNTDRAGAVQAKQLELVNLALFREATKAKEDVESRVRWVRDHDTTAARQRAGLAGQSYLDQWDGFLDRYEFKKVSQKVLDRRTSLAAWVAEQESQGLPVDLPASVLDDSRRTNYQTLSYEQFLGVTDGMRQILHLARLKTRLLTSERAREFNAAVTEIDSSIRANNVAKKLPLEFLPKDLRARKVADWFASHTKIATLARALDGYADGGIVWDYIIRPLNEAATKETAMKVEASKALHALFREAYTGREVAHLHDTLYLPAIGDSLSKEARLMIALNWGNEGNRQRVTDGRHWNDSQVRAILDTLDARDWKFVQGTWDYLNTFWPEIKAKQERVTGLAPDKVEATPVETKFGTFAGGYFPLSYDSRLSPRATSLIDASEANLQKQAAYVKATTRRGHTEARLERVTEPVRLDLGVLYSHVEQVIHDLTHHETLIDVGRVLGDKRIQRAFYETKGDQTYAQFRSAVKDIAYGIQPAANTIERALNFARNGTTIAGLAWNAWTAVQQPLGVFNGAARVGPSWVLKGFTRMVRDAASMENTAAWVNSRSEMMRLRGVTQQREVAELRNTIAREGGWFNSALRTVTADTLTQRDITDSYFALIEKAQRLADIPTWLGQYEKSMAAGETEARASSLADQAVLDSQSGGQIKDLAAVQRGSPAVKLFTNFYSYGNLLYNQTSDAYGQTNFRRVGSVGQFLENLALIYVFPAAATVLLAHAFGRSDDKEPWYAAMGKQMLSDLTNEMVVVRELGSFIRDNNRGYEGPTGTRIVKTAYDLGTQLKQGKADRGLLRASEDAAGILFRLPIVQVQRSIDGFVALEEGKTKNPLALLAGPPKAAAR